MKKLKSKSTLKTHITFILLTLTIITLITVGVISYNILSKSSKEYILNIADTSVEDYSNQIDAWFELQCQKLIDISHEISFNKYDSTNRKNVEKYLVNAQKNLSEFYVIYMACPDNYARFSDGWLPDKDYIATERDWYKSAANSDNVVITPPYTDAESKKIVFTISMAIKDSKGNVTSVLGADLFIDDLLSIVNKLSLMDSGYPVLTSTTGDIITHKNEKYLPTVDEKENEIITSFKDTYKFIKNINTSKNSTTFICKDYDGDEKLCISHVIPKSNWSLTYVVNSSVLNKDTNSLLKSFLLIMPLAIILITLLGYVLIKRCFRPLKEVSSAADEMTKGNLSVKFNYDADDEIGSVCRDIEETNIVLKSYVDDIAFHLDNIAKGDLTHTVTLDYIGDFAPIKNSLNYIITELNNNFNHI